MLINSPNISGSLTVTGNSVITGSLTVLGGINATITGSATSASYVEYSNVANKPTLVSGSEQVSFNGIIDKPTLVSGSEQITYSGLSGIPSGIVSSSTQITGYNIFATTGSNQFDGSQAITGSLTVTGQVVAQTLNVQQVTSSIVYSSGSNIFGNTLGNTQQFTGSVSVTGSLTVAGTGTFSSNGLFGGSSAISGLAGGISVNGSTNSGINFRIADTLRGYVYVAGNGSMNLESTSGSVVLAPNGAPALTISSTGTATFSGQIISTLGNNLNIFKSISATTGYQSIQLANTSGNGVWILGSSTGTEVFSNGSAYATQIGTLTATSLQFGTNSSIALTIASTGAATFSSSVTANSGVQSQVIGSDGTYGSTYPMYSFTGTTNGSHRIFAGTADDMYFAAATSRGFQFRPNGSATTTFTIASTGAATFVNKVGVGGASATYSLTAYNSANGTTAAFGGTLRGIRIDNDGTFSSGRSTIYGVDGTFYASYQPLSIEASSLALQAVTGGNVGIGTTGPVQKLHVEGSATIGTTGTEDILLLGRALSGGVSFQQAASLKLGRYANAGGGYESYTRLDFALRDNSAASNYNTNTTVMTLTNAGNVGIGTTSPTTRLDVRASVAGTVVEVRNERNAASGDYGFVTVLGSNAINTNSYHYIAGTIGGADRLYIYGNGNVVNINNSYGALSDIKLKENIEDASPKLDDLLKVKVRNYNLIGEDTKQIGVIAQELEEVFPAMIDESEDFEEVEITNEEGNTTKERQPTGTTTKSVKYSVFVPMLIKAIQEQQSQIEILKTKIEILEQS
jgi:hypothetical protein